MRWRWWYAAVAEAGVVRVVVRVGGSGCEGDVGGSASAVVVGFSGDGKQRCEGVRRDVDACSGVMGGARVEWSGYAMVMLVAYGGEEGGDVAVVGRLGTRRSNKVVAWRRVGWWIG
ncbi:hypothetical protein Tco_0098510 [Tanacetum coccineum]